MKAIQSLLLASLAVLLILGSAQAGQEASKAWTVDPTGRHLVGPDGKPFFWLGDTAWLISQMPTREDAELYLKMRARQGFTVIQAAIVMGEERVGGTLRPNAYGDTAFVDGDPSRPKTTPGKSPDNAEEYDYWDHIDWIVETASSQGLVLGVLPLFVAWKGDAYKYLSPEKAQAYGKFLGERYRSRSTLIWTLGGDNIPDTDAKKAVWHAMAKGINEGVAGNEDYSRTLMTYHSPGGTTSATYFHTAPWLDFNMIQTWDRHMDVSSRIAADCARKPAKPTGLAEGAYEDGPQYKTGPINAYVIRKQAYESYFSGGYHTFGNTNTWNFGTFKAEATQDWKAALDSPGTRHLSILKKILTSTEWWKLSPEPLLTQKGALALRSSDGTSLWVYFSAPRAATVDLARITGSRIKAEWVDPLTGEARTIDESEKPTAGPLTRDFMPPEGWKDALLHLTGKK